MIADTLAQSAHYRAVLPGLGDAFTFLGQVSPLQPRSRINLDGERLVALVQEYTTTAEAAAKRFESHRRHADLHYLLAGTELMHVAPTHRLTGLGPHDEEKDFTLYADPAAFGVVRLQPGDFALFFPHDGHKTGLADQAGPVRKVVIKVRLDG